MAHTLFPFDLFPDKVELDRHRLTIVKRWLFGKEKVVSTHIDDIANAEVHITLFLASVNVASKFVTAGHHTINKLRTRDAERLQKLLQGFIMAHKKKIEFDEVENEELVALLLKLGEE